MRDTALSIFLNPEQPTLDDQTKYFEKQRPLFEAAIQKMEAAFRILEAKVPPPGLKLVYGVPHLRYRQQGTAQALIQKMARYINTLHGLLLLLKHGFLQEQCVLQRTLDEIGEDVMFLSMAPLNEDEKNMQDRYLTAFFSEEFDEDTTPLNSERKRDQITRKKIRAYIDRRNNVVRDGKKAAAMVYQTYSGYVHSASPQLMELCTLPRNRFQLSGSLNTSLYPSHVRDASNYFLRGIMNLAAVSAAFGETALFVELRDESDRMSQLL